MSTPVSNLIPKLPTDPADIKTACDQLRAEIQVRRRDLEDCIEVLSLLKKRCKHTYPPNGSVCKVCGHDCE